MSHRPDLDDPDLDGDLGIDGDPRADHAAYDEWAAIAANLSLARPLPSKNGPAMQPPLSMRSPRP